MTNLFIKNKIVPVKINDSSNQGVITINSTGGLNSQIQYSAGNGLALDGSTFRLSGNYYGTFNICSNLSGTCTNFYLSNSSFKVQVASNCFLVTNTSTCNTGNLLNTGYILTASNYYFDSLVCTFREF